MASVLRATPWQAVASGIADAIHAPFPPDRLEPAGGGSINQSWIIGEGGRRFFVKLNTAERLPMFRAEAAGLEELAATATVRVPAPVCYGQEGGHAWIALEYLDLSGDNAKLSNLGGTLAQLHRHGATRFGWKLDNTIGATPQPNTWCSDWIEFLRDQRLGFQFRLAERNGHRGRLQERGSRLLENLGAFFSDYRPAASLLHGDLWGGNAAVLNTGEPVIFDPAVYYGDREADLAMTELFGGFPPDFYRTYNESWPLDPGYRTRKQLYNLYHLLNHLNLFGGSYLALAQSAIDSLLGEICG